MGKLNVYGCTGTVIGTVEKVAAKIVNQFYVLDYGVVAYELENGQIVMPVAYGGKYCTKEEFLEEEYSGNKDAILKIYEELERERRPL